MVVDITGWPGPAGTAAGARELRDEARMRSGTARMAGAVRQDALAPAALSIAVLMSFCSGPLLTATAPAPAVSVAAWRLWLAVAVLLPLGLPSALRSSALRSRRGLLALAGAGLALAAHFALWIGALRLTAVAPAVTLVNAAPLPLLGWEVFRGRAPARRQVVAVLLSLGGMVVLAAGAWTHGGRAMLGDALALGGACAYAAYLVAGSSLRPRMAAMPYNLCVFAVAAAILSLGAAGRGSDLLRFPARTWVLLALLAAGPTLLGHGLANFSLTRIRPTAVSLAYLLEPIGATLLAYLWLHQRPDWLQVAGGAVTLAGLALYVGGAARAVEPVAG